MFWPSTIIREFARNLASYIYVKTFGEITSLFIMPLCGSMSWNGVCCMLCRMQLQSRILHSMQYTRHSMTCCHTTA